MIDFGRRLVMDIGFEAALGETCRAMRKAGLTVIARIDVRSHFWRDLDRDFRQYYLIEAWSPELAFEALALNLDAGAILPITFAVYEMADGRTAIVAREPLLGLAMNAECRATTPALAAIADHETERVARVLASLAQGSDQRPSAVTAA